MIVIISIERLDISWIVVRYILQYSQKEGLMLAVNYSELRNNLKDYCDKTIDDLETLLITRKK